MANRSITEYTCDHCGAKQQVGSGADYVRTKPHGGGSIPKGWARVEMEIHFGLDACGEPLEGHRAVSAEVCSAKCVADLLKGVLK